MNILNSVMITYIYVLDKIIVTNSFLKLVPKISGLYLYSNSGAVLEQSQLYVVEI